MWPFRSMPNSLLQNALKRLNLDWVQIYRSPQTLSLISSSSLNFSIWMFCRLLQRSMSKLRSASSVFLPHLFLSHCSLPSWIAQSSFQGNSQKSWANSQHPFLSLPFVLNHVDSTSCHLNLSKYVILSLSLLPLQ